MKIRLLVSRAGAGFSQNRGDEIEVGEAEAMRMIAAGQAEDVDASPRDEPIERAVKRAGKAEKAVR